MSKCWVGFSPGGKTYIDPLTLSERWQIMWAGELALHVTCSMVPISGTEKNNNASPLTFRDRFDSSFFFYCLFCFAAQYVGIIRLYCEWSVWGIGQFVLYVNDGQMLKVSEFLLDYYWNNLLKLQNTYSYCTSTYSICKIGIGKSLSLWKKEPDWPIFETVLLGEKLWGGFAWCL